MEECIDAVDIQASFPGGTIEFHKWFTVEVVKTISGTPLKSMQGKVQFVVNEDGSVSDVKLVEISANAVSNSIVQILERSPKWNPRTSIFGNYPTRYFKQRIELPFDIKMN